ncbi:MAG: protocatechuate 3,4-dioxygenase subunit alpha [Actinobacteria bacterium]|nr:MAG: protocatechuate 3,4-dioxygenase subunit alpha [Actinomycetota bacterium]
MTLGRTPSQTVGPYFTIGLCRERQNEVVRGGSVRVVGRVLDGNGEPVSDALIELWQPEGWGRCGTDAEGRFEFLTERPADGYADVMVFARGLLKHLVTRCDFGDDDVVQFDVRLQGDGETVFFDV